MVPDAGIPQAPFLLNQLDDRYKLAKSDWMKGPEAKLQEKERPRSVEQQLFRLCAASSARRPSARRKTSTGEDHPRGRRADVDRNGGSSGARPVAMGFAETYTGLSQGVADFVECPPQAMVSSKFTELRKIVSLTNHMVNWNPAIVSQSSFAALPEDLQQIMIEESFKAGDLVTKPKRESDVKIEATLKEMGIEVVTDIDKARGPEGFAAGL